MVYSTRVEWLEAAPQLKANACDLPLVEDQIEYATPKQTIQAWRAFHGDRLPPGRSLTLVLADGTPQFVEVVAADHAGKMYHLGVECMICAKSHPPGGFFDAYVSTGFTDVPRTCPTHKGLWKPARVASRKRRKQAIKEGRFEAPEAKTPMAVLLRVIEAMEAIGAPLVRDELLEQCEKLIPAPPESERDTRRYRINRAIDSLVERRKIKLAS